MKKSEAIMKLLPKSMVPDFETAQIIEEIQYSGIDRANAMKEIADRCIVGMHARMEAIFTKVLAKNGAVIDAKTQKNIRGAVEAAESNMEITSLKREIDNITNQFNENLDVYKKKAAETGITRKDTDDLSLKVIGRVPISKKDIAAARFTEKTLREHDRIAAAIYAMFKANTLLVFVGRSVEWPMQHFMLRYPDHSVLHLPGSSL